MQSTTTTKKTTKRDTSFEPPETPDISFYTPIPLSDKRTSTVQAIQQTFLDLQEQKESIEITIKVLQRCLHFLLNSKEP